ncbi:HAD-IA family hydrolase [Streptomyces sp. NPDC026673]|uniref:HAD-IA family hydrolase n=1 Tax=Streptomyces sp. NPDC026673 TaxID=3155724 RepID=UPI0033F144DE
MAFHKGLILDFGGVLTTPLLPSVADFERREELDEGSVIGQLYLDPEVVRLTEDLERGAVTQVQWNKFAARRLGVESDNLLGRIFSTLRPEPLMLQAAMVARQSGIRVGVLSNSVGADPWDLYEGYELGVRFDAALISGQHGLRKPDTAIYERMLKIMELPANECVFVDDVEHNLLPAAELGMATVLAADPRTTIESLQEILGISLFP